MGNSRRISDQPIGIRVSLVLGCKEPAAKGVRPMKLENQPETKKLYAKPGLTEFGSIEKLSQGAAASLGDGVHVSRK